MEWSLERGFVTRDEREYDECERRKVAQRESTSERVGAVKIGHENVTNATL